MAPSASSPNGPGPACRKPPSASSQRSGAHSCSHAHRERPAPHAALTGAHLDAADALFLGLADHFVPSAKLAALAAALENESPAAAVGRFSEHPPSSALEAQQDWIDACYAADDAEEILRRMREAGGEAARRPTPLNRSRPPQ
jgi:enoyl-CoA hydratase/carnithine racemase